MPVYPGALQVADDSSGIVGFPATGFAMVFLRHLDAIGTDMTNQLER
jgi:hypothetical protein